jgi:methylthioribulose-1-phosphate dehydratase
MTRLTKENDPDAPHPEFQQAAARLAEIGRGFYRRGWALGTSGNYSAVLSREPARLIITSSGVDKESISNEDFLEISGDGSVIGGRGRPSAETLLHLSVVRVMGANAVLHTHSAWSTLLSGAFDAELSITGYEMLKGLEGVTTHEHRERIAIIENSQDMPRLAALVEEALSDNPDAHAFLLRRHGLYTWGRGVEEAKRHVEILEFLLEAEGRIHFSGK